MWVGVTLHIGYMLWWERNSISILDSKHPLKFSPLLKSCLSLIWWDNAWAWYSYYRFFYYVFDTLGNHRDGVFFLMFHINMVYICYSSYSNRISVCLSLFWCSLATQLPHHCSLLRSSSHRHRRPSRVRRCKQCFSCSLIFCIKRSFIFKTYLACPPLCRHITSPKSFESTTSKPS